MAELKDSGSRRDLIGMKYGRLTVLSICETRKSGHVYAHCVCDCGNEKDVAVSSLLNGSTTSCGCYRRAYVARKNTTHGLSNTRLYSTWCCMHKRCENPKDKRFNHYGGRGIYVCDLWQTFQPFYDWALANGYQDTLSIDRINVNDGYKPENCKWSNNIEQQRNTTRNHMVYAHGQLLSIAEWSELSGVSQDVIKDRLNKLHWNNEEAVTTPTLKIGGKRA